MTHGPKRRVPFTIAALSSASLLACLNFSAPAFAGEPSTAQAQTDQADGSAASANHHEDLFADLAAVEDTQLESHTAGGCGGGGAEALGYLIGLLIVGIICAVAAL